MTVTRTFILFFLMITSVIPAREGESNEPRRVRIGLFTFAPLNYTDEFGRAEGLFPALIDEFVKSSGWRVSYTEGSWFDLKEKLQRGEIDLVMGIGKTPEREKTMDFNREPVVELWGQIFIPPDSEIRTMKDLDGTAIALISNDRNSRNIVQTARESGISVRTVTYNSIEAVMEALENSEVQALAAPEYAGLQELRAYNLIGSNILFSPFSIYFAVKKGTNGHILEDIDRDMELWKGDSSSIYYRILKEQMGFHQTGRDELPLWIRFTIPLLILGILTFLIISIYLKETIIRRTAEIRNSEFNYNNLVQQLEAAVLRVDSDGGIIMINSYALGLLEVSRDELDGANVFDLNLLPTALSPAELNGNIPWKDMETISCVSAPRGALYFKWSINNVVTRGENGENPRHETLCIGIDISDQLNTEKALRSSETRFQSFMSNIPMFAYIKDENGAPVFFNRALKQLLGDGEEIQSRQKDFIPDSEPRKELKEAEQKILKGESGTEKLEYEVQLPSEKTPRLIQELMFPIQGDDNRLYIGGVGMDITETRIIEEQLNQSRKMQAIGELAGGIAHDFNNQLAGILGYADLLTSGISDDPRMERYALKLKSAVEGASEVTSQLLSFSRKGKKENRQVDVNRVIEDLISLLSHSLNKQIHIHFDERCEDPRIMGDPNLIQNALLNIAINARDAMENKGDLYFTSSRIMLDERMSALQGYVIKPGPYLKISVEDTGTGMSREVREKIFEPFFTTKAEGRGTGMGLSMVYGTMKEHQGNITVQSTRDKGTVFSLYFPGEKIVEEKAASVEAPLNLKGEFSIAVVDDEAMIRDFLKITLRDRGHRISSFDSGRSFLESLDRGDQYDMVILDMIMPEMGGIDCYRELKRRKSRIRVLLSSGYSRKEDITEIMKNDRVLYLQKPYSIQDLFKAIQELMRE